MTRHKTGTREEWLTARLDLLEAEKELTRRSDELARRRQELPWVGSTSNMNLRPQPAAPAPAAAVSPPNAPTICTSLVFAAPTRRRDQPHHALRIRQFYGCYDRN